MICKCENIYIYVIIIVVEVVFTVKNYRERNNIIEMLSVISKGWNELVNPWELSDSPNHQHDIVYRSCPQTWVTGTFALDASPERIPHITNIDTQRHLRKVLESLVTIWTRMKIVKRWTFKQTEPLGPEGCVCVCVCVCVGG